MKLNSLKIQRKVDQAFEEITQLLKKWKERDSQLEVIENKIRWWFEKIFNYQRELSRQHSEKVILNNQLINELKQEFISLSEEIYTHYFSEYDLPDSYQSFIAMYNEHLLGLGVIGILKKEKILEKVHHKLFDELLPIHPKDEYPYARAIKRNFIIHTGPTNSGKTYSALERLKKANNGLYLAPLRLLAIEVYEKLNDEGVACNLRTGEEEIEVPFANHISSTIEKADYNSYFDVVVIDETQMAGDMYRGEYWTRAILGLCAKEIHICCSVNAVKIISKLIKDCDDSSEIIYNDRKTPLVFEDKTFNFPADVSSGDALIAFSRQSVLRAVTKLSDFGIMASVIYGNLPPEVRRKQVGMFLSGNTNVVVSTDAIGMGMNLPVRRVIFLEEEKYDGEERRVLSDQEVKQIGGRAGRQGMYSKGVVNAVSSKDLIKEKLYKVDEDLESVFIGPSRELVMSIECGSLKEILISWKNYKNHVKYIEKANIDAQIELINTISSDLVEFLSKELLYKALYVPFDVENEDLIHLWVKYIKETSRGILEYTRPTINLAAELDKLETTYQELNMYYSFNKVFNKSVDIVWLEESRNCVIAEIHKRLIQQQNKTS